MEEMIFNLADTHLFFNDLEVRPFVFLSSLCAFLTSAMFLLCRNSFCSPCDDLSGQRSVYVLDEQSIQNLVKAATTVS